MFIDSFSSSSNCGPIGVFDSGYGGLTILKEILIRLPQYDYLYLGDNARAPYGTRSFNIVYEFTRQAVEELFRRGCQLVILACNTASAKALRSIQIKLIPERAPERRVLGVIRPTVEALGKYTDTGHIGVVATPGTAMSHSYRLELQKLYPEMLVTEIGCPLWVPIVEAGEANSVGADYFVRKKIEEIMEIDPLIDTLVLGCTHYPLLINKIRKYLPDNVKILEQGHIVANSLASYLQRHPEIEKRCTKHGSCAFLTTETEEKFNGLASLFLSNDVKSQHIASENYDDCFVND